MLRSMYLTISGLASDRFRSPICCIALTTVERVVNKKTMPGAEYAYFLP